MSVMLPAIIDVEASGFGSGSYPIEVGWVEGGGRAHCMLIRPYSHWTHWDASAEHLHGITRDILWQHGVDGAEVCHALNNSLKEQVVYSDAWANDMSWLACLFEEANVTPLFRIESLLVLLSESEREQWNTVISQIRKQENLTRHRASADAKIIQKSFRTILEGRSGKERCAVR